MRRRPMSILKIPLLSRSEFLGLIGSPLIGAAPSRARAIERGLRFIYQTASVENNFEKHGSDYLWCFYSIATTSKDPSLRELAWSMGRERGNVWHEKQSGIPIDAAADDVADIAFGAYALQQLGTPDEALKERVRQAAGRFSAVDFLSFDPAREPPPADLPYVCEQCKLRNPRGADRCRRCGKPLKIRNRYDLWDDALITTYTGDCYGVRLGARYADVVKWAPAMRPYPPRSNGSVQDFYDTLYSITHLIYTLNGYSMYRLSPEWLPDEFEYLKTNLKQAVKLHDPETMGEFMDTLLSFGMTEADPLIRTGVNFLMKTQNADGSWGNPRDRDIYNRYHSTWTAIDGLREYQWHGERLSFPELADALKR